MVRFVRAFFGMVPFALLAAPSCSDDESCCYQDIHDYCMREGCPTSFASAFKDSCHQYPDVFYEDGDRRAIGFLGGLGGYVYFYRGEKLVGVITYNDVLEDCPCSCGKRAECALEKEVGEVFFTAKDHFSGCTDCGGLTHCSDCPLFYAPGEEPPVCPAAFGVPDPPR